MGTAFLLNWRVLDEKGPLYQHFYSCPDIHASLQPWIRGLGQDKAPQMMLDRDHNQGDKSRRPGTKTFWILSLALSLTNELIRSFTQSTRAAVLQMLLDSPHASVTNNCQEQERQSFTNIWRCPASPYWLHPKHDSYFIELGQDHQVWQIAFEKVHIHVYSVLPTISN